MAPKDFVIKYKPYADAAEKATGILSVVTLSQAAEESGWGTKAPNNNFFGIKSFGNPKQQLLITFEYRKEKNLTPKQVGLETIDSVVPSVSNVGYFKYTGKSWFRSYDSPEEAFSDHAHIFYQNHVYSAALAVKSDPTAFVIAMSHYYAQSPTYAADIISIMNSIKKLELPSAT